MNCTFKKSVAKRYALALLILCLTLYPLFFRLDLTKSNYEYFDIIQMVPSHAWLYLFILCLLLSMHILLDKKIGLIAVIITMLLVYSLYALSQYDAVIDRDVFLHGRTTNEILFSCHVQSQRPYPGDWPSAFVYWASLCSLTGLDAIKANRLLALVFQLYICILLYIIGRIVLGETLSGLPGVLYLLTNIYYIGNMDHFNIQFFALTFYLLILYLLLNIDRVQTIKRRIFIIVLILCINVITSHAISSFYLFFALLGLILICKVPQKYQASSYLKVYTIIAVSWWLFNAGTTLEISLKLFKEAFSAFSSTKIIRLATTPLSREPLPFLGFILRNYYFKPLISIIMLTAILSILFESKKRSVLNGLFLGTLIGSVILLFAPIEAQPIQVSRILLFLLFPSCCLVSRLINRQKTHIKTLISIFTIFLIIPSFLSMMTYTSQYEKLSHNWEMRGYIFMAHHHYPFSYSSMMIGSDIRTAIYYCYFDRSYERSDGIFNINTLNLDELLEQRSIFSDTKFIIRSFRQELQYDLSFKTINERLYFWRSVDLHLTNNSRYDMIYTSSYMKIYAKIHP